jgi:hypothetical protein
MLDNCRQPVRPTPIIFSLVAVAHVWDGSDPWLPILRLDGPANKPHASTLSKIQAALQKIGQFLTLQGEDMPIEPTGISQSADT